MNLIRNILVILILITGAQNVKAQLSETEIRSVADSILKVSADKILIENVLFSEFLVSNTEELILNKNYKEEYTYIQTRYGISSDTLIYWIRYKVGNSPMMIQKRKNLPDSAYFSMYFLQLGKLYLTSLPDFEFYENYISESRRVDFVKKEIAIDSAVNYLPKKFRNKKGREELVFHEEDNKTYWVISRGKGMMEVEEYSVYIDAENGVFVRTNNNSYLKKLFQGK